MTGDHTEGQSRVEPPLANVRALFDRFKPGVKRRKLAMATGVRQGTLEMVFKRAGFKTLPSMKVISEIAQALGCPPGVVLRAFMIDLNYLESDADDTGVPQLLFLFSAMTEDQRAALLEHAATVVGYN